MNTAENRIPGYQILNELGRGGMATVYLAIQNSLKREVAVKIMSEQLFADPVFGERFLREAKIASRLVHPHIVTIYDMGTFEGRYFISMEYVPGENLHSKIQKIQLLDLVRTIRDIASALAYAGQSGYVHRDIKPENIMLKQGDGRAILMDFGIARACDNLTSMTQTGTTIGTPYYMSPEQAIGTKVDARSDLYSLGVVFFQLLSGDVPFTGDSAVSVGIKHISKPVPDLPQYLQSMFQPLINKLMAKNPADRFQSGTDLIRALDALSHAELSNTQLTFSHEACERTDETVFQPRISTSIETTSSPLQLSASVQTHESEVYVDDFPSLRAEPRVPAATGASNELVRTVLERFCTVGWHSWHRAKLVLSVGTAAMLLITIAILLSVFSVSSTDERPGQVISVETPIPEPTSLIRIDQAQAEQRDDVTRLVGAISTLEESLAMDVQVAADLNDLYSELASIEPTHNRIEAGSEKIKIAYQSHLNSLVSAGDYKAASEFLNNQAVVEFPELAESALAEEIQKKLKTTENIAAWLTQAEKLLKEYRLTGSGQENAFGYYTRVLETEPGNAAAILGINNVVQQYFKLAHNDLADKNFDEAQASMTKAGKLNSSLGAEIAEMESLIEAERQKELTTQQARVELAILDAQLPSTEPKQGDTLLLIDTVLTDPEPLPPAPKLSTLLIQSQEFASIDDHRPTALVTGRVVYIGFKYENFLESTTLLTAELYDGLRTVKISTVPVIVKGESGEAFFKFVQPVQGFSVGSYYLDVSMNNSTLGSYQFLIEK